MLCRCDICAQVRSVRKIGRRTRHISGLDDTATEIECVSLDVQTLRRRQKGDETACFEGDHGESRLKLLQGLLG